MLTPTQQIALSHHDYYQFSLSALGCGSEQPLTESAMGKFKNTIKDVVQIGLSTGAIVGTEGMAGDTIVDVLFALEESADMADSLSNIQNAGGDLGKVLKSLKDLSITNGTDVIYKRVQSVISRLVAVSGPAAVKVLKEIQEGIQDILNSMVRVVSKWISAIIPDDAGLGGPIIKSLLIEAINQISGNIYNVLSAGFKGLPAGAAAIIADPKKLAIFLSNIVNDLVKFLEGIIDPQTWGQSAQKYITKLASIGIISGATAGAGAVPAGVALALGVDTAIFKKLRDYLDGPMRQMIPIAVQAFHAILTQFFAQIAILQVIISEDFVVDKKSSSPAKKSSDKRLAAGFRPAGKTMLELRQYIRYTLESE